MNRNLRLTTLAFASILALMPLASAQQAQTQQTQATHTPALTAQNSAQRPAGARPGMQATFTLVRKVDALREIGKTPRTALNHDQASRLTALLSPLKTAKTLTTARATELSASIDRLLTPAQRTALDQAGSRMGGRMRGQPGQADRPGGRPDQTPGQMQGREDRNAPNGNAQPGTPPSGDGRTPGGQMQGRAGMAPDSNPFLNGRGGQILSSLLGQLQK